MPIEFETTLDQRVDVRRDDLAGAAVLVPPWLGASESDEAMAAIGEFVRGSGALYLADYGKGYNIWWQKPIYDAPGNRLLREAGIGFANDIVWQTELIDASTKAGGQFPVTTVVSMLTDSSAFSGEDLARGATLFGRIYDVLPPTDPLVQLLDAHFEAKILTINPTPATPVSDPFEKALLKRELTLLEATPLEEVTKHGTDW